METAFQQFCTRVRRVLAEYLPAAAPNQYKYVSEANVYTLAQRFDLSGFLPSDTMVLTEANILIGKGIITTTSTWDDAFRAFNEATQNSYALECNIPILERGLQGRCPTAELLVEIANSTSDLILTPQAAHETNRQAAEDARRAELFEEFAPKLIPGPCPGMNSYAVAIENKKIDARRQQMWNWPLSQLEELKTRKNMRNMPNDELRKIANSNEPARKERIFQGVPQDEATSAQVQTLHTRGQEQVRMGIYRPIPSEFQVPGKEITVPWSFQLLRQLPKEIITRLITMYGDNQLTEKCQETQQRLSARK
jgi:hypothetical protein